MWVLNNIDIEPEKIAKRNEALKTFGDLFWNLDDSARGYSIPILDMMLDLEPKFKEKIDLYFEKSSLPGKVKHIAKMLPLVKASAPGEYAVKQFDKRIDSLLDACVNSGLLARSLNEFKDFNFDFDEKFYEKIIERVERPDFTWNMFAGQEDIKRPGKYYSDVEKKDFLTAIKNNLIPKHPPNLRSYISSAKDSNTGADKEHMQIQLFTRGALKDIGYIYKNQENTYTLRINRSAQDLAYGVNGIPKNKGDNEINFKLGDVVRISNKLFMAARNDLCGGAELLEVSSSAAREEKLFYKHGKISFNQKSMPNCTELSRTGAAIAVKDETGDVLPFLFGSIHPEILSDLETASYSLRFPTKINYPLKVAGVDPQRISFVFDDENGLIEWDNKKYPVKTLYEKHPKANEKQEKSTRFLSGGSLGVALHSLARATLTQYSDMLYSNEAISYSDNKVIYGRPSMGGREAARLVNLEQKRSYLLDFQTKTQQLETLNNIKEYLRDPSKRVFAGTRFKTQEEQDNPPEDLHGYERESKFFKRNGHYLSHNHAFQLSIDLKSGQIHAHCPHDSNKKVPISEEELFEYFDHIELCEVKQKRAFIENRLPN